MYSWQLTGIVTCHWSYHTEGGEGVRESEGQKEGERREKGARKREREVLTEREGERKRGQKKRGDKENTFARSCVISVHSCYKELRLIYVLFALIVSIKHSIVRTAN